MPKISYLPSYYQDLASIASYITNELEAPKAARNLVLEVRKAVNGLKEHPLAHHLYQSEVPLPLEFRILPVKNYNVFYTVLDDGTVEIHRVIYKRRNFSKLIK
ncbi:MAG: type II toxin-antitoxin system RelE/ParE family toxin [Treponema sp.]|jgi:plasmid stabilization system protein ParE|nr:type II toxin-antitoxin system RelE/ParE family toxin [Treponema sp.]